MTKWKIGWRIKLLQKDQFFCLKQWKIIVIQQLLVSTSIKNILLSQGIKRKHSLTDKGIEAISEYLAGNTTLQYFSKSHNDGITDNSITFLNNIATKTYLKEINIQGTSISDENQLNIKSIINTANESREIGPRFIKSAAKISLST